MKQTQEQTNAEVVRGFLCHDIGDGFNLVSDGQRLWSYGTVIAQWAGSRLLSNQTTYTKTTTKHQGILMRVQRENIVQVLNNVPKETQDLIPFIVNEN